LVPLFLNSVLAGEFALGGGVVCFDIVSGYMCPTEFGLVILDLGLITHPLTSALVFWFQHPSFYALCTPITDNGRFVYLVLEVYSSVMKRMSGMWVVMWFRLVLVGSADAENYATQISK